MRRNFLRLFIPLAFFLTLGFGLYAQGEIDRKLGRLAADDRLAVHLGAGVLDTTLDGVVRDLMFLAAHSGLRDMLDSSSQKARTHLVQDLLSFAASRGLYDQIRWLDEGGQERIRVEYVGGEPALVPSQALQDKRDRYYFNDTRVLPVGEVFVSPLDLNVEFGAVERPYKPVIRVGTPVADSDGRRRGILMLNYFGSELLAQFARATESVGKRAMLVNADGYWLRSAVPADEWGFMLERPEMTMAVRNPQVWKSVRSSDSGQLLRADGLWSWRTVRPLGYAAVSSSGSGVPAGASARRLSAQDYRWKVLTHLPAENIAHARAEVWTAVFGPALVLLLLAALGSWKLSTAWSERAGAEARLREANRSLRQRVEERTQALNQKVHALIESDTRFRTTFETATVGIARVSPQGCFIEINQAFCELIGYSREEMLRGGFSFQQITHKEDLEADMAQVGRLLRGEADSYAMEKRYLRKDGSTVWANLSVAVVRDHHGAPQYFVSSVSDLSERKRLEAELLSMANSDFLTGLANRRYFIERLTEEWSRLKREEGRTAGVLMLDIDYFKRVNDAHGHAVGDELLRHFAVLLGHELRRIDTVGRIGGEEFAIILPGASIDAAGVFAERLRRLVADSPMTMNEDPIAFTVSIGVAVMTAQDANVDAALVRADEALYRAKEGGRNRVEFSHGADDAMSRDS